MIGAFVLIVARLGGVRDPRRRRSPVYMMIPLGVVLGALVAFIIFGRRAQKSVYRKAEGQTGAAAWALDNLRGKWRVTPGVAATGHFDAVHRVIGRPGVIFVGEGSAAASNRCWLRRRSAPPGWSATSRSTTSWSATARARCRWPSWNVT